MNDVLFLDGIGEEYVSNDYITLASIVQEKTFDTVRQDILAHYNRIQTPTRFNFVHNSAATSLDDVDLVLRPRKIDRKTLGKYQMLETPNYERTVNDFVTLFMKGKIKVSNQVFTSIYEFCQTYGYVYKDFEVLAFNWNVPISEVVTLERVYAFYKYDFFQTVREHYSRKNKQLACPPDYQYSGMLEGYVAKSQRTEPVQQVSNVQSMGRGNTHGTATGRVQTATPNQVSKPTQQGTGNTYGTTTGRVQTATTNQVSKPTQQSTVAWYDAPIVFDGVTGDSLADLCKKIGLGVQSVLSQVSSGVAPQQALYNSAKQEGIRRAGGSKVTSNAMLVQGRYYPNLQFACECLKLNHMEVSFYKSKEKCTAREAVYYHLGK